MPIQTCVKNGKTGKKFGVTGKCYIGKSAESKARTQGRAIKANQSRSKKR